METPILAIVLLSGITVSLALSVGRSWLRRLKAARQSPRDASNQLRFVSKARFFKKHVMNKSEYTVFRIVEGLARAERKGYRVFAQTSLGEIIGSEEQRAYESINSKRIDILVVDATGLPMAAIEYQGRGHYQGNAILRDAVKREALHRAGIAYVEILEDDDDDQIRRKVRHALDHAA